MDKRNILPSILGYAFECYNNVIFGLFSVTLAPLFFPEGRHTTLASFGAFAAGYLMRPIGGTVFGYIGDMYGRKKALKLSIFLLSIPSVIISILPTYESIGFLSPLILVLCRLVQGISTGGDYSGTITYVAEQQFKDKTFVTCVLVASGFLGGIVGTLAGASLASLSPWAWRFTFFMGGVISLFIYFLRSRMDESKDFESFQQNKSVPKRKVSPRIFFSSFILGGANLVPIYVAIIYMNKVLMNDLGISSSGVFINNLLIFTVALLLVLVSSRLIKRFGAENVMIFSMIWLIIVCPPLFYWSFESNFSLFTVCLLQVVIIIGDAPQIAALTCYIPKCFPIESRHRGLGISFTAGQAFLGGPTPVLCWVLVEWTQLKWAPVFLLLFSSILYILSVVVLKGEMYCDIATKKLKT